MKSGAFAAMEGSFLLALAQGFSALPMPSLADCVLTCSSGTSAQCDACVPESLKDVARHHMPLTASFLVDWVTRAEEGSPAAALRTSAGYADLLMSAHADADSDADGALSVAEIGSLRRSCPTTNNFALCEIESAVTIKIKCILECVADLLDCIVHPFRCASNFIRSIPVGANHIALGYFLDFVATGLAGTYPKAWCPNGVLGCTEKQDFWGPGTTSVMGWSNVADLLRANAQKEWAGEWWRGNELGFLINDAYFWTEEQSSEAYINPMSIALGSTPRQHAAVRPVFEAMFTLGARGGSSAAGAEVVVRAMVKDFFAAKRQSGALSVQGDLTILVHRILMKVAFNEDTTDEAAAAFVKTQGAVVALATLAQILPKSLYFKMKGTLDDVRVYRAAYTQKIRQTYAGLLPSDAECAPSASCAAQAGAGTFDALYAAGGLSVPTNLASGIALLYDESTANSLGFPQRSYTKDEAMRYFWENTRLFAPVVGFPHWEPRPTCAGQTAAQTAALMKPAGQSEACPLGRPSPLTGYPDVDQYGNGPRARVVGNLALANQDPAIWGADAAQFRIRPLSDYHAYGIGFADLATDENGKASGGNGRNRNCPGKDLALLIGQVFFEEFKQGAWEVSKGTARIKPIGPVWSSTFTLRPKL